MFFITLFVIKEKLLNFQLAQFFVDTDQIATFPLLTYLKLTQISYSEIRNFPDDFISFNEKRSSETLRKATFMTIMF